MRRFLYVFLVLALLFSLAGCSFLEKEDAFDVEECLEEVEELIEDGEYEEAEKLLKRGIRKADDPEKLEACLMMVQAMLDSGANAEATTEAITEAAAEATTEATTEATAEVIPEDTSVAIRPSSGNLLDGFTRDQTYQINVFLSNFSEQNFGDYPGTDYDLIDFGYMYAKINNREVLGSSGGYYYVEKGNMDSILTRFFGKTVSLPDPSTLTKYGQTIEYRGGVYYFPAADGESVAYCTAATSMEDNGNGTYTVYFSIYAHENPHDSMSPYYSMTADEMAARSELNYQGAGQAVVRDYTRSNGVESYQLISYVTY